MSVSINLLKYTKRSYSTAFFQIFTSYFFLISTLVLNYFVFDYSIILSILLSIISSVFIVRIFILFHDCAHNSFTPSKKLNIWIGRVTAFTASVSFYGWKESHLIHHKESGKIESRKIGELRTLTKKQYLKLTRIQKIFYKVERNPITFFIFGPIYFLFVTSKIPTKTDSQKARSSFYITNLFLSLFLIIGMYVFSWNKFLIIYGATNYFAAMIGIWLFYIQHQYPKAYWKNKEEWNFQDAALKGSSYYDLPKPFHWLFASITYHHIHHLNPSIPNYNLKKCHEDNSKSFNEVNKIKFVESLKYINLDLYDDEKQRLI